MGDALLDQVTVATGLPEDLVTDELTRLLKNAGVAKEAVTLDDLREILADYLQDIMLEITEAAAQPSEETSPEAALLLPLP